MGVDVPVEGEDPALLSIDVAADAAEGESDGDSVVDRSQP
jgi:hypothetical protein